MIKKIKRSVSIAASHARLSTLRFYYQCIVPKGVGYDFMSLSL